MKTTLKFTPKRSQQQRIKDATQARRTLGEEEERRGQCLWRPSQDDDNETGTARRQKNKARSAEAARWKLNSVTSTRLTTLLKIPPVYIGDACIAAHAGELAPRDDDGRRQTHARSAGDDEGASRGSRRRRRRRRYVACPEGGDPCQWQINRTKVPTRRQKLFFYEFTTG